MSKHVSEWLNAYHDGELRGSRLHTLEAHLAECDQCCAELESLESLSDVLHEVPVPEFTSTERFAAQVNLRLPHDHQPSISRKQILEIGWWMMPVGLLAAWVFLATSTVLTDVLSAANQFGLLNSISNWMTSGAGNDIYLSATLGQAGLLSGFSLNWAEATETITRTSFTQLGLQISIALLYLSWIAVWWVRQVRRGHGPLFGR
jgi:hypothetical protein